MSPILDLQRQLRTLGRIRTGNQVVSAGGKRRPAKLETFRLTSEARGLIEFAAATYGGQVTPWRNGDHDEFEVVTETPVLDIIVPPGESVSQWNEMWAGGGCLRRCDGETNVLTMTPCACPTDVAQKVELAKRGEACKATTRLKVMLPALPDLGVWMLESHSFYAATELGGAAEILAMASASGRLIPARLRLEQRVKKVPGQPPNRYGVPIIEFVETRMADLPLLAEQGGVPRLAPGRMTVPALPAAILPPTSDFRAPIDTPLPAGAEPSGVPANRSADAPAGGSSDGGPSETGRASASAPPAGRQLCGAPAQPPLFTNGETCGLPAGHLAQAGATQQHRALGPDGVVQGSWPAEQKEAHA